VAVLLAIAGFYGWLRWFERQNVYQPTARLDATGDELGFPRQDVWLRASDGTRLHAWYFPAAAGTNGPVFLLCHGNGGNISHRLDQYDVLLRLGVSVFAFDYRGYGRSEGSPGEEKTYRDAASAHDWLTEQGFTPDRIVALGESLGGGVAAELALRRPLLGLVLQSTFTSVPDLGAELFPWLPVRTVGTIQYDTRGKLPSIHLPVLFLHSRGDTIIPFAHAEANFEAAHQPKWLRELRGDHNDTLMVDRDAFGDALKEYLVVLESSRKVIDADALPTTNPANDLTSPHQTNRQPVGPDGAERVGRPVR
jgi:pimeloyl-ACP methyl ester carboxylesterase